MTKTLPKSGSEPFRPYARLISVLGDQLITSKWVGVIELVKNSYDADANNVVVRFSGFDEIGQSPVIEIEDNGDGMNLRTILDVWMKPATPYKLNRKKSDKKRFTKKKRLMQGDKGVGRFAIYKLGNNVQIFTKTKKTKEIQVDLNFREYAQNDEFADNEIIDEKFLDEIKNKWQENEIPIYIKNKKKQGTLIRISDLRNNWKHGDLQKLQDAFQRMIPPIIPKLKDKIIQDFNVKLLWNDTEFPSSRTSFEDVIQIAPFIFEGKISQDGKLSFTYSYNNKKIQEETINLFDQEDAQKYDIWKLKMFKDLFLETVDKSSEKYHVKVKKKSGEKLSQPRNQIVVARKPNVGSFEFYFYAFDLRNKLELDFIKETFIKDNSVYLYRDLTRVYPYGERGNDWLLLSKLRAEARAGHYFSYNDLIGFIFITQRDNPKLRDAASREGLVNNEGAYDDFIALIQASLKTMKDLVDIDKRKAEIRKEKAFITINKKFDIAFNELRGALESINEVKVLTKAQNFFKETNNLIKEYNNRLFITQELAGLGMAVEKSSHDTFMLIEKMIQNANDIVAKFDKGRLSATTLKQFFDDLIENLDFLYQELQVLQPLFRQSRKVINNISVRDVLERIQRYYRKDLQFNINLKIQGSNDLIVRTNLGLMLQVFINLIDNAIYWLNQKKSGKREILINIDENARQIIVADNGRGINEDLAEIIFLEFYSTKAYGRGLGLYIVSELLERINASISLITTDEFKILSGANFLIQFDEDN